MKVLHVNAGLETGGGLTHIINLLTEAKIEHQDFTLLCLAAGPVSEAAKKQGLKVKILGAQSRYDLASLKNLAAIINTGGYDIVHTHGARANLFVNLIKKRLNATWCVTVHSDPFLDFAGRGLAGKIFTKLNLHALKQADCIFAVTKRFGELLTKRVLVAADKVHVIYNGIFFQQDDQIPPKLEHDDFNIINVARTEKVKGQELLLQAVKAVNQPRLHLAIAGDGSQLQLLVKLAQQLGISQQVTFYGFLSQEQLRALYQKMDLAVLTSYSESFPLVLLEASDNLVPILSTDVGDIRMMIPDSAHGFVAQTGSVTSIVASLGAALAKTKMDLTKMAQTEKQYTAANFSVKEQLKSIMKVYRQIIE